MADKDHRYKKTRLIIKYLFKKCKLILFHDIYIEFHQVFQFLAIIEARDVYSHLKALEPYFEEIQNMEFKDIQPKLKPLMHCVCLTWSNSKHYCTSTRIITLLLEISNLLITQVNNKTLVQYLYRYVSINK